MGAESHSLSHGASMLHLQALNSGDNRRQRFACFADSDLGRVTGSTLLVRDWFKLLKNVVEVDC